MAQLKKLREIDSGSCSSWHLFVGDQQSEMVELSGAFDDATPIYPTHALQPHPKTASRNHSHTQPINPHHGIVVAGNSPPADRLIY